MKCGMLRLNLLMALVFVSCSAHEKQESSSGEILGTEIVELIEERSRIAYLNAPKGETSFYLIPTWIEIKEHPYHFFGGVSASSEADVEILKELFFTLEQSILDKDGDLVSRSIDPSGISRFGYRLVEENQAIGVFVTLAVIDENAGAWTFLIQGNETGVQNETKK